MRVATACGVDTDGPGCPAMIFASTAIDRGIGIGIGRFGVEKTTVDFFDFVKKIYGTPAKNVRAPKPAMRRFYY